MRRDDGKPHEWKMPRMSMQRGGGNKMELRGKGGSAVRDLSSSADLTQSSCVTLVKFLHLFVPHSSVNQR